MTARDATPTLPARALLGWLFAITALTVVCYLPALDAGFIWDDNDWLTENPQVTEPGGLVEIWSGAERLQYYPVLFTAFRIEFLLWGLNPTGYHVVNVVLHALNAFLLGWLLYRLRIRGAWWVALLFAVHPVHVESVAWITELKNVLSGFFYLAALHWFVRSDEQEDRAGFLLSLLCFATATLTKTATVTLPAVLLLILVWKKRSLTRTDFYRLAPFFLVGGALAAVTVQLEKGLVAVVQQDFAFSWLERLGIAARALFFYPWKLLVPWPLIFNYPRWNVSAFAWSSSAAITAALLLAAALVLLWKRGRRGTVCAVLFYVVTIFPALGFFDVYAFRYSFVADHFQYLASIGLLILLVQAGLQLADRAAGRDAVWPRIAGGCVVLLLAGLSFAQSRAYRDLPTLWRDTVAKNPNSWIGHHSLALHFKDRGSMEEALRHADEAIRCKPGSAESHTARALIHAAREEPDRALVDLNRAVELDPSYPQARLERARVLLAVKRAADALADLELFLSTNPDYAPALHDRGRARVLLGRYEAALSDLDRAILLGAGPAARIDRGSVHAQLRRFDLARADAEAAIRLDGEDARAHLLLGVVEQMERGDRSAACAAWRRACELGDCRYFEQRCAP